MRKTSEQAEARRAAAKAGKTIFVTPKPCDKCGSDLRYVLSNQCVPCSRKRAAEATKEFREMVRKARSEGST